MLIFFVSVLNKDLMKPPKLPFSPAACGSLNVNLTQLNCWIKMNSVALYQWNQRQCCTSIKNSSCWPQAVSEMRVSYPSMSGFSPELPIHTCWLYLLSIEFSGSWFSSCNFDVPVAHCCPRSLPITAVEESQEDCADHAGVLRGLWWLWKKQRVQMHVQVQWCSEIHFSLMFFPNMLWKECQHRTKLKLWFVQRKSRVPSKVPGSWVPFLVVEKRLRASLW